MGNVLDSHRTGGLESQLPDIGLNGRGVWGDGGFWGAAEKRAEPQRPGTCSVFLRCRIPQEKAALGMERSRSHNRVW